MYTYVNCIKYILPGNSVVLLTLRGLGAAPLLSPDLPSCKSNRCAGMRIQYFLPGILESGSGSVEKKNPTQDPTLIRNEKTYIYILGR